MQRSVGYLRGKYTAKRTRKQPAHTIPMAPCELRTSLHATRHWRWRRVRLLEPRDVVNHIGKLSGRGRVCV